MEPGDTPEEILVTIENRSDRVDEYSVEVAGLAPTWFALPQTSARVFVDERAVLRVTLRPPRSSGSQRGSHPFQVVVRSARTGEQVWAEATLSLGGIPDIVLELNPIRKTSEHQETFHLKVANRGTAPCGVRLSGVGADASCDLRFKQTDLQVPAHSEVLVPVQVRPRERPARGESTTCAFTITAYPDDPRLGPVTEPGELICAPRVINLRLRPVFTAALGVCALVAVSAVLLQWAPGPLKDVQASLCAKPVIDVLCPGPHPRPVVCTYDTGFKAYAEAEPVLVGTCLTPPVSDRFGNVRQYSTKGVLFWEKTSNTVFFLTQETLYAFLNERSTILHGPGAHG